MTTEEKAVLPPPAAGELELMRAHIEQALDTVADLCRGRQRWTMTVPAEPERDPDLVIGRALDEAKKLVDSLKVERADSYNDPTEKRPYMRFVTPWHPVEEGEAR